MSIDPPAVHACGFRIHHRTITQEKRSTRQPRFAATCRAGWRNDLRDRPLNTPDC
jgi:hypothetical protein